MLTKVVPISAAAPEEKAIREAARAVREGKLVVFPTETVYGIAVNALDPQAIERLYAVKGRPKGKPLSWHIDDIQKLEAQAKNLTPQLRQLIAAFWPGPLTVVVANRAGGKTGFRMPDHPVALALIRESGVPVVAPSANLSGGKSPVTAEEALADLNGKVDLVLNAGKTPCAKESTVLDITETPPRILREGAVSREKLEAWFKEHAWTR